MELEAVFPSDLGSPAKQNDILTDHLAYTEIRKPDVHAGARVFGVVDLCVDSGVDDDESAAAREDS